MKQENKDKPYLLMPDGFKIYFDMKNKPFLNMECGKCGKPITKEKLRWLPPYWDCKCGNRNQKHIAETWAGCGEPSLKDKKKSIMVTKTNTIGERSIIYRDRNEGAKHEVVDKNGKILHKKHKLEKFNNK